jgi:tRNA nucleotidyltransferase (CCA-adding enzyme)
MLLILTHENADFDAIASQLAAHKLYPQGVPLLSWRVNRNVEQYLTLFWDAYPFLRPDDWQRRRIDRVVLVDTQALPSVRGLRPDRIEVQVIDHHELAEQINERWSYHIKPLGATTSLLVEMLQESGLNLNANEATLLLLGIHEDTGSLVYDTTTARDAQAAAWLLEQGAQLSVVRRFLNIPLSGEQRRLFDSLQDAAEWKRIEGQDIVFSAVVAPPDFDDEISAIAHCLRDTLMPSGIVLLVELKHNHIQLVGRSSTDNVDVSILAREFGGGGHIRAAAATIMNRELDEVTKKVGELLPKIVRPMTKVEQIMSYGLQTISANDKISDAAAKMQRFGHEGYPVINPNNQQLVGLLTRRLVDRAMNHQLGELPVSQVMRAGRVFVHPSDSVERVQRLMIQEGWGQIPVAPDAGHPAEQPELIGIVTRTDLIALLNKSEESYVVPDLRDLMVSALPKAVWDMVQEIGGIAGQMDMPLYFVGGLVRDLILGIVPADLDMVVEGEAITLVNSLRSRFGGDIRSHAQFGTAKWLLTTNVWRRVTPQAPLNQLPMTIDFVSARTEFYTRPTALPEVERGSIKLDLHRRDFSINTLAVRLDGPHLGQLLNFYGGLRDLESGLIRVLHSLSFVDDPTRILRAVRLEQRLDFTIDPRTAELITAALDMLDRVTGERVRNELEMCLRESKRIAIMSRLAEMGVLAQLHPGLTWHPQTADYYYQLEQILGDPLWAEALGDASPVFAYFALLLLPLSATVQGEVMSRLKVRKLTREDILSVQSLLSEVSTLPGNALPSQVVFVLRSYSQRVQLVALATVGPESDTGQHIDRYHREWRHVSSALNGNDLLAMGLKRGPQIGTILDQLLVARLDGEVLDESGERKLVQAMMHSGQLDLEH